MLWVHDIVARLVIGTISEGVYSSRLVGDTTLRENTRISFNWNHTELVLTTQLHMTGPRNFFPINAPGMGPFKLFDLVGYS